MKLSRSIQITLLIVVCMFVAVLLVGNLDHTEKPARSVAFELCPDGRPEGLVGHVPPPWVHNGSGPDALLCDDPTG